MLQNPKVVAATAQLGRSMPVYSYAYNNPLHFTDEDGRYGTKCCKKYKSRCEKAGGGYYCDLAKAICENAPKPDKPNNWSNCVRKCLQDRDEKRCADTSNKSSTAQLTGDHLFCWTECFSPEKNPLTGEVQADDDPAECQ